MIVNVTGMIPMTFGVIVTPMLFGNAWHPVGSFPKLWKKTIPVAVPTPPATE
jgi:hypothetical protein